MYYGAYITLLWLVLVYDDYKFLTRSELDGIGLSHLIGTDFVRAYMHGFFLDIRLYRKVRNSFDFVFLNFAFSALTLFCLQSFDAVGWAAGRASGL